MAMPSLPGGSIEIALIVPLNHVLVNNLNLLSHFMLFI